MHRTLNTAHCAHCHTLHHITYHVITHSTHLHTYYVHVTITAILFKCTWQHKHCNAVSNQHASTTCTHARKHTHTSTHITSLSHAHTHTWEYNLQKIYTDIHQIHTHNIQQTCTQNTCNIRARARSIFCFCRVLERFVPVCKCSFSS